jgi:hypothetical protein
MTKIIDFFGFDTGAAYARDWSSVVQRQHCPFIDRRCYKVRKSQPEISIGTCTVKHANAPIIICPPRLLERRQIFTDCLHLLTGHEPGNELHLVPEVSVPGGLIDYILASVRNQKVRDFVGIELQALDTSGTVWPERQRFLASQGFGDTKLSDTENKRSYGMNWKMTAKTILVQLHHKIQTFEGVNKHLVLVIQDGLLEYMANKFSFGNLNDARTSDPMHFHAYQLKMPENTNVHRLDLAKRMSTDTAGIAQCLGLQNEAKIGLDVMVKTIEQKITDRTLYDISQAPPAERVNPDE